MKILRIVEGTSVDGPGLRTAIYFAGCSHHCPGCHNPQSWDAEAGQEMTLDQIMAVVDENGFGVTLTGGDPLYDVAGMLPVAAAVKERGLNLWCYTGYTFEQILADKSLSRILGYADVIVDGRFEEPLRDIKLRFRGSSNQRMVDVKKSLESGYVILYQDGVD